MTSFGDVLLAFIVIGLPVLCFFLIFRSWMSMKQRKFELEAGQAVEKAAQYAATNAELEARVRVLEKIVTDGGVQTAAQIEALRDPPSAMPSRQRRSPDAMPFDKQEHA